MGGNEGGHQGKGGGEATINVGLMVADRETGDDPYSVDLTTNRGTHLEKVQVGNSGTSGQGIYSAVLEKNKEPSREKDDCASPTLQTAPTYFAQGMHQKEKTLSL